MTIEASSSKCGHPPRTNRPCSSSSGPPGPCITPSTETWVVVVSLMRACPCTPREATGRAGQPPGPTPPGRSAAGAPILVSLAVLLGQLAERVAGVLHERSTLRRPLSAGGQELPLCLQ